MARHEKTLVIEREGRDKNKVFLLTEMSARRSEGWAIRMLGAMARSGIAVDKTTVEMGLAGIAQYGLRSFLAIRPEEAMPLLDELLDCVKYVADPKSPMPRALLADDADIEEPTTYFTLRDEVFKLHTGFSMAGSLLSLVSVAFPAWSSESTSTSPEPSGQSSAPASPPS